MCPDLESMALEGVSRPAISALAALDQILGWRSVTHAEIPCTMQPLVVAPSLCSAFWAMSGQCSCWSRRDFDEVVSEVRGLPDESPLGCVEYPCRQCRGHSE